MAMSDNDDFIDLNNLQDEVDIESSMLKELIEENQDIKDRNIAAIPIDNGKKNKLSSLFKKKEKDKGFINIEVEDFDGDFVIVSQDSAKIKNGAKIAIKATITLLIAAAITGIVASALLFKATNLEVQGGKELFDTGIYISPTSFVANTSRLRQGDRVVVSNQNEYIPYLINYSIYEYAGRTGQLLTLLNEDGDQEIIDASSVEYILQ